MDGTMTRITIPLSVEEREALRALAKRAMRDPREHVRFLLREELNRNGLLNKNSRQTHTTDPRQAKPF